MALYASPRQVFDLESCFFYHTIDLPGYGLIRGEWDLRSGVDDYLGHVALDNKRVLEIGTASGFLCFEMEKRGAELVAYDLSEQDAWDIVPYGGQASPEILQQRKEHLRAIHNAWWLTHRILGSRAKMVYGNIYQLPLEIGPVQIATFGSILLHLRDPFLALQCAAGLVEETIIVTEALPVFQRTKILVILRWLAKLDHRISAYLIPTLNFLPDPQRSQPWDTWWNFSPELIEQFLRILGFTHIEHSSHTHTHHYGAHLEHSRRRQMYTVVGHRA